MYMWRYVVAAASGILRLLCCLTNHGACSIVLHTISCSKSTETLHGTRDAVCHFSTFELECHGCCLRLYDVGGQRVVVI